MNMTNNNGQQGLNRRKVLESIGVGGALVTVGGMVTSAVSANSDNSVSRVTGDDLERLVQSKLQTTDVQNLLDSSSKEVTKVRPAEELNKADESDIGQEDTVVAAARKKHPGGGTSTYLGIVIGRDRVIRYVEQDLKHLKTHQNDRSSIPKGGSRKAHTVKSEARLYAINGSEIEDITLSLVEKSVNGSTKETGGFHFYRHFLSGM